MRLLVNFAILIAALGYLACNVVSSPVSIGEALDLHPRGKLPTFLSPKSKPKSGGDKPGGGSGGGGAIGTGEGGAIGAGSGTINSYSNLLVNGEKYTRELDAAIASKKADKVIDGPDIFQRYFVHRFDAKPADGPVKPFIQGDVEAKTFVRYRIANKQDEKNNPVPEDKKEIEDNVITQISVSKDRGTIVNEYSYAGSDTLRALGQNPMRFSDQVFQAWKNEGGTNGLTTLVQNKVVNKAAKDAIIQGHRGKKAPLSRAQTWGPEDDTYKALMGSDNGRPFVYMLKDHHNALGNKKVTEIHTVGAPDAIIWYKLGPA